MHVLRILPAGARLFSSLLAILLFGCQSPEPAGPQGRNALLFADFEQCLGWGAGGQTSLNTEKAHSGKASIRVTPDVEFSYTYARPLGDVAPTLPRRLALSAWALCANTGSTAKIVLQIVDPNNPAQNVFYEAVPLIDQVREFDTWVPVAHTFELPTGLAANQELKLYLWRDQALAPAYLDDVELRIAQ